MFCNTLCALTGLLAIVSALPNTQPSSSRSCFTDNFENTNPQPVGASPVGVNNGVTYQAWSARSANPVTGTTGGVIPHSGSKDIVTGITQDATQIGSVTLNPFGNILATPSKAFDLYSFWFGCSANLQQAQASESVACVLSVIGFNVAGQQLPVVKFSYSPNNPLASPMVLASLPSYYRGLKNVTLGVAASTTTPTETGLWVDDDTCSYQLVGSPPYTYNKEKSLA